MIYIPDVKKRLEELKPRWMSLELSEVELFELYDLLDVVILEARKERSAFQSKEHKPENYLLDEFLKEKIQIEVKRFMSAFGLSQRASHETRTEPNGDFTETPTFREWFGYARQVTRTIILGDSTERPDRKKEIDDLESNKGSKACLVLNSNWLYSYRDKLLGEEGSHKNINAVLKPESLLREGQRLKALDWEDMDSRWTEIKGMKGDGFFIRDIEAVNVSRKFAKEFKQRTKDNPYYDEPTGYVPGYKKGDVRELIFLKKFAEDALNDWRAGENPEIKTEQECIEWIETHLIGRPMSEVINPIEIPETRPNFILYTFGNVGKRGRLYLRLREYRKRLYRKPKPGKPPGAPGDESDEELEEELYESEFNEVADEGENEPAEDITASEGEEGLSSAPSEIESCADLRERIIPLLSLRQKEIYDLYFIKEKSVIEIMKMYHSSRQNIYNHLHKIVTKINGILGVELSIAAIKNVLKVKKKEPTREPANKHAREKVNRVECPQCKTFFDLSKHDGRCPFCHSLI